MYPATVLKSHNHELESSIKIHLSLKPDSTYKQNLQLKSWQLVLTIKSQFSPEHFSKLRVMFWKKSLSTLGLQQHNPAHYLVRKCEATQDVIPLWICLGQCSGRYQRLVSCWVWQGWRGIDRFRCQTVAKYSLKVDFQQFF